MSKIKVKLAWYLVGTVVLGLGILAVSCSMIEPPAPPPPVATIVLPVVPHSIEGRADCRACHAAGVAGAPQFPANHSQRPSDVCLTCHAPASVESGGTPLATMPPPPTETTLPEVSAVELFNNKCAACHGVNRQGVPGLTSPLTPESLAALSDTEIRDAISAGRPGTAMPSFEGTLSPEEIDALLQLIKSPVP